VLSIVRPDPWAKQPEESDDEFALFCIWLLRTPRPAPDPADRLIATRNEWASRATAWDNWAKIPKSDQDVASKLKDDTIRAAGISLDKIVRAELSAGHLVMSVKEAITLLTVAQKFIDERRDNPESVDLTSLTDEELEQFEELSRKAANARR
jgi:hypothetical protein